MKIITQSFPLLWDALIFMIAPYGKQKYTLVHVSHEEDSYTASDSTSCEVAHLNPF